MIIAPELLSMLDNGFLKALGVDCQIASALDEASSQTVLLQIFHVGKVWTGATQCQMSFPELVLP
jgi:hypothetical protein